MSYISQTKINKCSGTQFDLANDAVPQVDQTLVTSFGVGTEGTGQCIVKQDYQFDLSANSFEFNSVNGPSVATGTLSMSNATNQALGSRAVALGGTNGIVGANATNSGTYSVDNVTISGTGNVLGAVLSEGGQVGGNGSRKSLLGAWLCNVLGDGSFNHVAYCGLVTCNTTGSLNTSVGCWTGTWLNGAKESGMWGSQAGNIDTTNARVNIWGGDNNRMTGDARNAGIHDGEGLISNTVDQLVHGSYNIPATGTTLSNAGNITNMTRVHGNGNGVLRHNAAAESSRGEYYMQVNGHPSDLYTTAVNTGVAMAQPFPGQDMAKIFVNYNTTTSQYELWFGSPNGNILIASI